MAKKRKMSTFERLQGGKLNRTQRKELQQRLQAADPGLTVVHPDAAGIDVGNASHFVAVPAGRDPYPVREFGSWTADLHRMAEWLKCCGIGTVAIQSTGVYWIALQEILEEHRAVRTVWRLRDRLVQDAGRAIQQIQKALTTMNIRLANAIRDVSGVTGMAIIRAILRGERDPRVLAQLRDARVKASEEEVARCLEGHWREEGLFELEQVVQCYDFYQRRIAACDQQLKGYMAALPDRAVTSEPTVAEVPEGPRGPRKVKQRRAKHSRNQPTSFTLR